MKSCIALGIAFLLSIGLQAQSFPVETEKVMWVIHGGAGTILRSQMTPEREKAYQEALTEAYKKAMIFSKMEGLDATEAVVPKVER